MECKGGWKCPYCDKQQLGTLPYTVVIVCPGCKSDVSSGRNISEADAHIERELVSDTAVVQISIGSCVFSQEHKVDAVPQNRMSGNVQQSSSTRHHCYPSSAEQAKYDRTILGESFFLCNCWCTGQHTKA